VSQDRTKDLVWDQERLRIATDAAGFALWSWNVDTDEIALDQRAHGLWGVPEDRQVTFESLSRQIHPEDLDRVRNAFEATRTELGAYEIDFRITHGGDIRWISARGQGGDVGMVGRIMFAVFLDVTKRKQAEEAREMLAGEMSHRVKNLFSIATALTSIAARSAATTADMAKDLTQRLTALGRAHDLIRPLSSKQDKASLGALLAILLAPYSDEAAAGDRVQISTLDVPVGETAATTLALIVHELATNSIKHGALSAAGGSLEIECTRAGADIVMVWTERGGPPIPSQKPEGFGTKLLGRSVAGQLGGLIDFDWQTDGLVATVRMNEARIAR
jgi:two-component sensor histidine kinase